MNNDVRVLVTGGAGMIGSNLVKRLVLAGFKVTIIDNLWRGKIEYLLGENGHPLIDLKKDFHNIDLSIPNSADQLFECVDYVFHLADIVAGIGYVFSNQGSLFRQNVLINSNTITAFRKYKPKGFIYVGTACSFPAHMQTGVDAPPLREEDQYPAAPESAYGWSKLMGEYETLLLEKEASVPVCVPVLHNVYGAPCDYGELRGQVIPSLIRKVIRFPSEPFIVRGSGSQGRAFVHVDDVVDGLISCMNKGLGSGVIQLGPDTCTSIRDIAETVVQVSGKQISIQYDKGKPEGDKGRCADYSKARRILGWTPKISLRSGITSLYEWIEARMAGKEREDARPVVAKDV
jgi:nucleoside-diphosphate-sugar epimerase